jgi:hypothetical protein
MSDAGDEIGDEIQVNAPEVEAEVSEAPAAGKMGVEDALQVCAYFLDVFCVLCSHVWFSKS